MTKIVLSALALLCTTEMRVVAQEYYYDAYFRGDKVGYMKVVKQQEGAITTIHSETNLEVSLVMNVTFFMIFDSEFDQGNLRRSLAKSYRDGDLEGKSTGSRSGDRYIVDQDGERKMVHAPEIVHTVINIHYGRPSGTNQVFSERWGEFLLFEQERDGRYGLHLPNGNVNYYTYSGNVVRELEVNYGWFSMEFRLRE